MSETGEELFKIGEKIILEKLTPERFRRLVFGAVYYGKQMGDERIQFFEPSSSIEGALDGRSFPVDGDDIERTEDGKVKFTLLDTEYVLRPMEESDSVVEENGGFLYENPPEVEVEEEDEDEDE